jgi:hypothetical protein
VTDETATLAQVQRVVSYAYDPKLSIDDLTFYTVTGKDSVKLLVGKGEHVAGTWKEARGRTSRPTGPPTMMSKPSSPSSSVCWPSTATRPRRRRTPIEEVIRQLQTFAGSELQEAAVLDTRKVQTAVLRAPESLQPIAMPFERIDAILLRDRYAHEGFFCGEWLGGCGRKLYTRIGPIRIPHFAHTPENQDPISCRRAETDEKSADHLYIRRDLSTWMERQGRQIGQITIDGRLPMEGGYCTGLTIPIDKGGILAVSIRNGFGRDAKDEWQARNRELRRSSQQIDWLFMERLPVDYVYDEQGYVFRVRCETVGLDRTVKIGTQTRGHIPRWSDLSECKITDHGLWTPHVEEARKRSKPRRQAPATTPTKATPKSVIGNSSATTNTSEAKKTDFPGFPIIADNIVVIPQTQSSSPMRNPSQHANMHAIFATIKGTVSRHGDAKVKIILTQQMSNLQPGKPHRLISPCTVDIPTYAGYHDFVWNIYACGLEPIDAATVDDDTHSASRSRATGSTGHSDQSTSRRFDGLTRSQLEAFFEQLDVAREKNDLESAGKLIETIREALPLLPAEYNLWTREQFRAHHEWFNRAISKRARPRESSAGGIQAAKDLTEWIVLATLACEDGDLNEARQCHEAALELFPRIPIDRAPLLREQLDAVRNAISRADILANKTLTPAEIVSRLRRCMKAGDEQLVKALRADLEAALNKIPGPRVWTLDKWVGTAGRWLNDRQRLARKRSGADRMPAKTSSKTDTTHNTVPAERNSTSLQPAPVPSVDRTSIIAAKIRQALESTAKDQALITWRQLAEVTGEGLPSDSESRKAILVKVDQETEPDEPLLSSLIIAGDRQMHLLYPEVSRSLSRPFPSSEEEARSQWATEVLKIHQKWRHV